MSCTEYLTSSDPNFYDANRIYTSNIHTDKHLTKTYKSHITFQSKLIKRVRILNTFSVAIQLIFQKHQNNHARDFCNPKFKKLSFSQHSASEIARRVSQRSGRLRKVEYRFWLFCLSEFLHSADRQYFINMKQTTDSYIYENEFSDRIDRQMKWRRQIKRAKKKYRTKVWYEDDSCTGLLAAIPKHRAKQTLRIAWTSISRVYRDLPDKFRKFLRFKFENWDDFAKILSD